MLTTEEELLRSPIFELIKERAECRFTITPCTTCFLIVRFKRAGHLIMDHETDVGLVDTHPKSVRRHDGFQLASHERFLGLLSITRLQAPVIFLDLEVKTLEPFG